MYMTTVVLILGSLAKEAGNHCELVCIWVISAFIPAQVIVMSGHETIRVLEVEVDAPLPSSAPDVKIEGKAGEAVARPDDQNKASSTHDTQSTGGLGKSRLVFICMLKSCAAMLMTAKETTSSWAPAGLGEPQVVSVEASAPAVQTLTPAVPISVSLPQAHAAMPISVQGCPQVWTNIFICIINHQKKAAGLNGLVLLT